MNNQNRSPSQISPVLLAVAGVLGSLVVHAALLTGVLSLYSAVSTLPSAPASIALLFVLPVAVPLVALAGFIKYARASSIWQAVMLALLAMCAVVQVILTPFWLCLASRSFCL